MSAVATDQRTLTLRIDLIPSRVLNPNQNRQGFVSPFVIKSAESQLRTATKAGICILRAESSGPMPEPFFTSPVRLTITVYKKKGGQSWDDDNLKSACKRGVFDVLQAEGVVENDRLLRIMPVEWARDPDGLGYMELAFTEETTA